MNAIAFTLLVASFTHGASDITGQVVDARDRPVANARVFVEHGLESSLLESTTSSSGTFRFEGLGAGLVGVFAIADGFAFGGTSIRLMVDESVDEVSIRLKKRGEIKGKIVSALGGPVEGARITRVVLLGNFGVGIPYSKLRAFGFSEPTSDSKGRFTISTLPQGVETALKIAHRDFAQDSASGIRVGGNRVEIELSPGVLVSGDVLSQGSEKPVSNASILVRNTQPPYGTIMTRTGAQGTFIVRLKPGSYLYQAAGAAYRSHGWKPLAVTGEMPAQHVSLHVAGTGTIEGKIMDASSGKPIRNARVLLEYQGIPAHYGNTGASGHYIVSAAGGEYVLTLDSVPGYQIPKERAMTVQVASGKTVEVPNFWLVPNPTYSIRVLDTEGRPTQNPIVRVLRPPQFGWRELDETGRVELSFAHLPIDGTVVGFIEDPDRHEGALFAISKEDARDAVVQLLPLASVTGRVVSKRGPGIEGYVVEGRFVLDLSSDAIVLWRTITDKDGRFWWRGVAPHVPQICVAYHRDYPEAGPGDDKTVSFMPELEGTTDVGQIVVAEQIKARSVLGNKLKWSNNELLCGELDERTQDSEVSTRVVMYSSPRNASTVLDSLTQAQEFLKDRDVAFALVVDGDFECDDATLPVLAGTSPGTASTFLLDERGVVVFETFGLPPLHLLNEAGVHAP